MGGYPGGFVRTRPRRRLPRARDLLQNPQLPNTVSGVAPDCGFTRFGCFALRRRELFGEEPSETLAGGRDERQIPPFP